MLYPVWNIAGVVSRVMLPALAEIADDLPRFRGAYLRAVSAIATVTFPVMLGLLVTAPEVIVVVYGPRWAPAVPILQVLCGVGMLQSVGTTVGWIYLARARTDLMLWWGMGAAVIICSSFVVGVHWGVMGVTVAYAVTTALLLVPSLAIPYRLVQLPLADLVRSVRGTLAGSVVMASVVALVRAAMMRGEASEVFTLMASVASGVTIYLAWLWLTDSCAIGEARMAWARIVDLRGGGAPQG
jgi:PST family polysaccharide transporter